MDARREIGLQVTKRAVGKKLPEAQKDAIIAGLEYVNEITLNHAIHSGAAKNKTSHLHREQSLERSYKKKTLETNPPPPIHPNLIRRKQRKQQPRLPQQRNSRPIPLFLFKQKPDTPTPPLRKFPPTVYRPLHAQLVVRERLSSFPLGRPQKTQHTRRSWIGLMRNACHGGPRDGGPEKEKKKRLSSLKLIVCRQLISLDVRTASNFS